MTLHSPKISVVIPTYNRENLLGECIEAVLSQTTDDFEVITVSDGSTDNTEDVVKKFDDPRVLFFEKENGGQASARNLGIIKAKGEYISLCDDDDRFYADHLITLSNFLDSHPNVGLAYSDSQWISKDGSKKPEVRYSQDFDKKVLENYNYITPLNVMFRKSCVQNARLFNEDLDVRGLEDWEFFLFLSDQYPFWHVSKVTSEYSVHDGNSFQPNSGYDYTRAFLLVRELRFQYLLSEHGVFLFDHVNHMYPFYLIQCYLDNGKMEHALEVAINLYRLFGVYSKKNNKVPFTELFILFALGISSFAAGCEEDAKVFIHSISKSPSFKVIESEFIGFVRRYISTLVNRNLKALLRSAFENGRRASVYSCHGTDPCLSHPAGHTTLIKTALNKEEQRSESLEIKLHQLPHEFQSEVEDFINYLLETRLRRTCKKERLGRSKGIAYDRSVAIELKHLINTFKSPTIFPNHLLKQILGELTMAVNILRHGSNANKFAGEKNLKVNIGCRETGMPGWINVDICKCHSVNCVWDCRKKLPFENDSVSLIFTEHFLEHLDYYEEVINFLSECKRVLVDGGIIRIIVPDLEKYIRAYSHEKSWDELSRIRPLIDGRIDHWCGRNYNTKLELISEVYHQGYEHKSAYDFDTLHFVLDAAGFRSVIRQDFMKSVKPELLLDREDRASESLYVEAVK